MEELTQKVTEAAIAWFPTVLAAVAILVLGWIATKIVVAVVRRLLVRAEVDEMLVKFGLNLLNAALLVMVVIAALGRLGVNTTSFAAVVAAAGLAVGLAFQDSLSNFASGVLIIVFRPFDVGDFVEVGGVSGSVEEVQIFTTVLNTPDNKRVILGNATITASNITNYSANDTRRVDLVFGIGYEDDIPRARTILERLLREEAAVLEDPEPVIAVSELADSSVNFVVRPWVRTADYWTVHFALTEKVKVAFDEADISIPFPQRDVHLHAVGDANAGTAAAS